MICFRQDFITEETLVELQDNVQKIQSKISNFMNTLDSKK